MLCDAYNKSLTEAAAAGRELTPALRRHLSACESCRAAFAEEQSLFAAIDASLRSVANPEVPATLIPRVHVALNNEPSARTHSQKWIFTGATLAAVLLVALALKLNHGNSPSVRDISMQIPVAPTFRSRPPNPSVAGAAPQVRSRTEPIQSVSAKPVSPLTVEVLVPDEERAAFEKFLKRNQSAPMTVSAAISALPEAPKALVPLQPVEIASLKVPLLNGEETSQDEY